MDLTNIILKNSPNKIIVFGDIILDHYIFGETTRISPESPVPIVNKQNEQYYLGGAANVAKNIKFLNNDVILFGVIGNDRKGSQVENLYNYECGHDSFIYEDHYRKTTVKTRIISNNEQIVRLDDEDSYDITSECKIKLIENLKITINKEKINYLILSDYGKGIFHDKHFFYEIIKICKENNIQTILDPHNNSKYYYKNLDVDYLKCNLKQAINLSEKNFKNEVDLHNSLQIKYSIKNTIITMAEKGISFSGYNCSGLMHFNTEIKEIKDVTGAGDTVIATLAVMLNKNIDIKTALDLANKAANIKIQHRGPYAVKAYELIKNFITQKYIDINLIHMLKQIHKDEKIVFVNGCFDILHPGHINLLKFAKSKGNILVVGLNSDESIKKLKGESRPIFNQSARTEIIQSLEFVDYVCVFNEDTPKATIDRLNPDVHVKGSDHEGESDGVLETYFFKRNEFSTTEIIKKCHLP